MSSALTGSSAIWCFEGSNAIKICDKMTFDFYMRLPHIYLLRLKLIAGSFSLVMGRSMGTRLSSSSMINDKVLHGTFTYWNTVIAHDPHILT